MLVLASTSPRRAMLLQEAGFLFQTVRSTVSETLPVGMLPKPGVRELAERKARAGLQQWLKLGGDSLDVVLGADTMVVLDTRILGKPSNPQEAEEMLQELSGRTHVVLTGVALLNGFGKLKTEVIETFVVFRQMSPQEIKDYVKSGEPMDKAGAYGIQGEARKFVTSVEGSLTNVIGLPMEYLTDELKAWGIMQANIASREVNHGVSASERST
ncbi:MAF protein [Desulfosporosinus acidiphilus SJ4]|uniref:dTTP/UTP pyrophosphatase n=1 Tax=Desulfosporosinus acidiphilus (strain DSM 22704 / JCM 16185 / SJ4) TaxID=646529 RepID=I4DBI6_DESAJ|nr:Maf family protein [Desulfosporosinus acidiphilus]AFM43160.1 MAF protein [Desulfosporosinus acidiphilus SJ4]